MNIRYKPLGKAVLFDGANYEELIEVFNMREAVISRFGSIEEYKGDAMTRSTPPKPLVYDGSQWFALSTGNYAILFDGVFTEMKPQDFNDTFVESIEDGTI